MKKQAIAAMVMGMALLSGRALAQTADFTLTRQEAGPPVVGIGACMNPYLYAYPNWPGEINERNVGELEAKIKSLHPQFVRIFFLQSWWEKDTDPVIAQNHPGMKHSLIRTIRLAQEAGAKVLLQFWYDPGHYAEPEKVARRFAETVVELRQKHGLTSVQFVTMQNEPNENQKSYTKDQYVRLYRGLDKSLRDLGIRPQIQIIGGDLVSVDQADWIGLLGRELSPVLDGYSVHAYWAYWDTAKLQRRIRETRQQVDALPAEQRRPLYVTEFGVQGKRPKPAIEPGTYEDGRPLAEVPEAQLQTAWFVLEALNNGFIGTCQWDLYEVWYDRKMGYGVIGDVQQHFPQQAGYELLELFTTGITPGSRVMRVEGKEGPILVTVLSGSNQRMTAYLLNPSKDPYTAKINGLSPHRRGVLSEWTDGKTRPQGESRTDAQGTLELKLVGHSLILWREEE